MDTSKITNATIMTTDWAASDKASILKGLPRMRRKSTDLAKGFSARGIWMRDVSVLDRRSVKAQLAGHGDYRAMWWNINCVIRRLLSPSHSLEDAMYGFHKNHHAVTLFWIGFKNRVSALAGAIRSEGLKSAIRNHRLQD